MTVRVESAIASQTYPGESESGDCPVLVSHCAGLVLGAIDGLGNGPEAAVAAQRAAAAIEAHADDPLDVLVSRCHQQLHGTRGAVLSLASLRSDGSFTWLGVGNVAALLLGADVKGLRHEALISRGGVVGYQLPALRIAALVAEPGDLLLFATDGVDLCPLDSAELAAPVALLAPELLARYATGKDDAFTPRPTTACEI